MGHDESHPAPDHNKAAAAALPEPAHPEPIPGAVFAPPPRPPRAVWSDDHACAVIGSDGAITDAPLSDLSE
jgi:hypothetical protein